MLKIKLMINSPIKNAESGIVINAMTSKRKRQTVERHWQKIKSALVNNSVGSWIKEIDLAIEPKDLENLFFESYLSVEEV